MLHVRPIVRWSLALAALGTAVGCLQSEPARFKLDAEGYDRATLDESPGESQQVVDAMAALFGTPDEPFVPQGSGLDLAKLQLAAGPTGSDQQGRHRGLYREHCAACHGLTGDGAGPAAIFLNPYPRDFRRGIFKYTSTHQGRRATTDDLRQTIQHGVPGTGMPSFALLPEEEIDALVEYVRYLALRGETEALVREAVRAGESLDGRTLVDEVVRPKADEWRTAADYRVIPPVPRPADRAASITAGRVLFNESVRGCNACHGATGTADRAPPQFDVWNNAKRELAPEQVLARFALPLQEIRPRNLRIGSFRGGDRPEDLYARIYAGVKGTPMPGYGPPGEYPGDESAIAGKFLTATEIWNLVDYVLSLPQESMASPAASRVAALALPLGKGRGEGAFGRALSDRAASSRGAPSQPAAPAPLAVGEGGGDAHRKEAL